MGWLGENGRRVLCVLCVVRRGGKEGLDNTAQDMPEHDFSTLLKWEKILAYLLFSYVTRAAQGVEAQERVWAG